MFSLAAMSNTPKLFNYVCSLWSLARVLTSKIYEELPSITEKINQFKEQVKFLNGHFIKEGNKVSHKHRKRYLRDAWLVQSVELLTLDLEF